MKANNRRAELVAIIAAELAAARIMQPAYGSTEVGFFFSPHVVREADELVAEVEKRLGGPIYEEEL